MGVKTTFDVLDVVKELVLEALERPQGRAIPVPENGADVQGGSGDEPRG